MAAALAPMERFLNSPLGGSSPLRLICGDSGLVVVAAVVPVAPLSLGASEGA